MIIPTTESTSPSTLAPPPGDTLLKALVRAHRWKQMPESGQVCSLNELAKADKD